MFVPSFLALWWPKIDRKSGFRNFSRKLFLRFPNFLYQMQPRYLPHHDTLVGRVMPKFFSNKFFLNDSHQCSYHNDLKIGLFVGYFLMGWVLIRAGVYCPHLWAQLVYLVRPIHDTGNGTCSSLNMCILCTKMKWKMYKLHQI